MAWGGAGRVTEGARSSRVVGDTKGFVRLLPCTASHSPLLLRVGLELTSGHAICREVGWEVDEAELDPLP